MHDEKLTVDRCFNLADPDRDDAGTHRWRGIPYIETTEHGPVAWWCCERCPARTIVDPESEDAFEPEPVVVYPPSCFGPVRGLFISAGGAEIDPWPCGCPAKASGEIVHHEACAAFQVSVEAIARAEAPELPSFPGVESRRLEDGRVAFRRAPEPDIIVHPPTDPAPEMWKAELLMTH